jgi:hypothetical protein
MTKKPLLAFFILAVSAFGTGAYVESNPGKEESAKSAGPAIAAIDSYRKGKELNYQKKSNAKPPQLPSRSAPTPNH